MRVKHLLEGLNAQQQSVPQLPAQAQAKHISVLGAKTDPKHPFAGYMVGAGESAEPGRKRIGPDRNDPYEKGWRAQPDATNPYAAGTPEHSKWQDGRDERAAQPRHYDESVDDDMPDLEEVGEPVSSIMDAERRMAAGDRIFVAHEMDEEPFEVFNVGDLKGYTYDQMLAVPQGVEEGRAGVDDTDTVGFSVNTEAAYTAVMKRFGDVIDHDETSGVMYAPARVWPQIEMVAFDADGEGATRDDGIAEQGVAEAERNEMDTPAVQAALAKMAERHKGEKWSKEQLAALGKRIAARGQKKKGVEETVSTHKGGQITKTPTGIKHQAAPGNYGGYEPDFDHLQTLNKNITGRIERSMDIKHKREKEWQGGIELDEDVTKEDIITKLKARLGDYLSDISKEIKKDPALIDKLSAKAPGDQMGPPVKTITTDDGHEISIHGNEDDGFRISIKNQQTASRFNNLDEAVMACEMYCARRRQQAVNADYVEEA